MSDDGPRAASDGGPGASLRALVASAVDGDLGGSETPVTVVERGDDPGPAARLSALVGSADDGDDNGDADDSGDAIVGVVPRIDPSLARRVSYEADGETRLVFTGSAGDRLDGPAGAAIRSTLAARGVEAYRHEGDSPIGVVLVGERAVVGLFDERGLAAVLWSDALPVREWTAATCRRYLGAADPV